MPRKRECEVRYDGELASAYYPNTDEPVAKTLWHRNPEVLIEQLREHNWVVINASDWLPEGETPASKRVLIVFDGHAAKVRFEHINVELLQRLWCKNPYVLTEKLRNRGYEVLNGDDFESYKPKEKGQPKYSKEECLEILKTFVEDTGYISNAKYSKYVREKKAEGVSLPGHRTIAHMLEGWPAGQFREGGHCDARCWNARSKVCHCSCGGKNHGKNVRHDSPSEETPAQQHAA